MKTRLARWFLLIVLLAMVADGIALSKTAGNMAYVQSGPDGIFYARCIPDADKGSKGVTEVYRVRKEGDELVDRYDWYTSRGVVLGWSPIAGKVAIFATHNDESPDPDKQVEFTISLGGKLLKSWTTTELQNLGARVSPNREGGKRCEFQVKGCEQIPGTNEYVFVVQFGNEKRSFDILTGVEDRK